MLSVAKSDALLDFPGNILGWRFGSLNKQGSFVPGIDAVPDTDALFNGSILRAENDRYCMIGRDLWHPGYNEHPALQYEVQSDGYYEIAVAFSPILHIAKGPAKAVLRIDETVIDLGSVRSGQILKSKVGQNLTAGCKIIISFSAIESIDNLRCWYQAQISEPSDKKNAYTCINIIEKDTDQLNQHIGRQAVNDEVLEKARDFEKLLQQRPLGVARFFSVS